MKEINQKILIIIIIILLLQSVFLAGQTFSGMQINDLFSDFDRYFDELENQTTPLDEYFIGRAVAANILAAYEVYTSNQEITNYSNMICRILAVNSSQPTAYNGYCVMILDSREFNAFATPGGHIFITRGLLEAAPSEDALAAVIAHELAHIMLKHGMKMIDDMKIFEEADLAFRQAASLAGNSSQKIVGFRNSVNDLFYIMTRNGYSVPQELEADTFALELLAAAGYSQSGLLEMLNVLQRIQRSQAGGFNSTHPSPAQRIANLESHIAFNKVQDKNNARRERFDRVMGGVND